MSEKPKSGDVRGDAPVKQVLVEEPVTKRPDVPGDKPRSFRFVDWAQI